MIDCAVIGDSIAVGLGPYFPVCETHGKIGATSGVIVGLTRDASVAVISAGSNDPTNPSLLRNLRRIRAKISGKVAWVLPIHPTARAAVLRVARENGDHTVSFTPARDRVHPKSYRALARDLLKLAEQNL